MNSIRSCYTSAVGNCNSCHKLQTKGRLRGYERSGHILAPPRCSFTITVDQFDKPKPHWAVTFFLWMQLCPICVD